MYISMYISWGLSGCWNRYIGFWSRKLSGLSDVKRIGIVYCIWMFVEVVKKIFKTETAERITVVMLFMFCVPIFIQHLYMEI